MSHNVGMPAATPVSGKVEIAQCQSWLQIPWLLHGFSTRQGGETRVYTAGQKSRDLNLGFTPGDTRETVLANRAKFLRALTRNTSPELSLITLQQVHSAIVHVISGKEPVPQGDGMMTAEPGLLLGIQTADCIPVLVADCRRRAVAAFHAGWRGTVRRITETGVGRMRIEFGSRPEDLIAAIGPGIRQCCYAVGEEVCDEFSSQFAYAADLFREVYDSDPIKEKYPMLFLTARAPGHSNLGPSMHLDLVEANRRQLLDAGVPAENVFVQGDCTSCRTDRYFSYRAEHGFTGRMLSVIGISHT